MTGKKLSSRSLSREKRWEQPKLFLNFYRANEVWSKVIFSQACVKNSVHSGGGAWSRGCLVLGVPGLGRHLLQGGSAPGVSGLGGCLVETPAPIPHRLLLRAVRILLECILVFKHF